MRHAQRHRHVAARLTIISSKHICGVTSTAFVKQLCAADRLPACRYARPFSKLRVRFLQQHARGALMSGCATGSEGTQALTFRAPALSHSWTVGIRRRTPSAAGHRYAAGGQYGPGSSGCTRPSARRCTAPMRSCTRPCAAWQPPGGTTQAVLAHVVAHRQVKATAQHRHERGQHAAPPACHEPAQRVDRRCTPCEVRNVRLVHLALQHRQQPTDPHCRWRSAYGARRG